MTSLRLVSIIYIVFSSTESFNLTAPSLSTIAPFLNNSPADQSSANLPSLRLLFPFLDNHWPERPENSSQTVDTELPPLSVTRTYSAPSNTSLLSRERTTTRQIYSSTTETDPKQPPLVLFHNSSRWCCTLCGKNFYRRDRAEAHEAAHRGIKSFFCKGRCGNESW